jgi:hypothetical protein
MWRAHVGGVLPVAERPHQRSRPGISGAAIRELVRDPPVDQPSRHLGE